MAEDQRLTGILQMLFGGGGSADAGIPNMNPGITGMGMDPNAKPIFTATVDAGAAPVIRNSAPPSAPSTQAAPEHQNFLQKLFSGGLTKDNSALKSPSGQVAISSPIAALRGANQALNAAGPSTNFDVQDGQPVLTPNPNQGMLPKIFRPSFNQASTDSAGNVTKVNKSETKLGILAHILRGGFQGVMDAAAGGAFNAPRNGESSFGMGAQAAMQMPIYRQQLAQQKQRQGLEDQVLQGQVQALPFLRQKQQADLENTQSQTAWHNAQTKKAGEPTVDHSITPFEVWRQQNPDKPVSEFVQMEQDAKPTKDPNSLDAAWLSSFRTQFKREPNAQEIAKYQREKSQAMHITVGSGLNLPANASGMTGDAALQGVDANTASLVKKIANYELDPSKVTSMRSNERKQIMGLVSQYDPTYDMSQYGARTNLRKDFSSGKMAQNIRGLNTAIGHLNQLKAAADKLGNKDWQFYNAAGNYIKTAKGDPQVTNFDTAATAVESELASVFKGMGATDQEISAWRQNLSHNMSHAQIYGAIDQALELMGSRMGAIAAQWQTGMNKPKDFALLSPKSRQILKGLGTKGLQLAEEDQLSGGGASPTGQQSAAPAPATHIFDPTAWKAANPKGDVNAAIAEAKRQGYQVKQ